MRCDSALEPRFPERGHEVLRSLRNNHFWFSHRRARVVRFAAECLAGRLRPRVLEFGCGDGHLLDALSRRWWAVGLERRMNDLRLAREAGLTVVLAEGSAPPFSRSFDLVGLFDVVEHVEDDAGLLDQAANLVAPDGYILLTVPADPRLWSSLDDYAGHVRRYTRKMVLDLFARAGLVPGVVMPIFRVLWPLGWLRTLFVGRRPVTEPESEYRISALANPPLRALLALERGLLSDSQRGVGTSWLASARLPESARR